jgi:hypothetical protein
VLQWAVMSQAVAVTCEHGTLCWSAVDAVMHGPLHLGGAEVLKGTDVFK